MDNHQDSMGKNQAAHTHEKELHHEHTLKEMEHKNEMHPADHHMHKMVEDDHKKMSYGKHTGHNKCHLVL